ncbi:MAG TPA: CotH kinase family protein [Solirubrobacterales bacterium]|nr:CotH kinase family protein [Solirubrobacterales bacterium]
MRAIRASGLALAFFLLSALPAQVAVADEAGALYDPSAVVFIDLTLSDIEKAKLEATPDEYVKGTLSMTKSADGTPSGEEASPFVASRPVEVRLKGSKGGSFRKLTEKAAFKLKFKKADAVLGLRKMTLNNMVQDPSMVHETLAYAAFRAAGVPASRTGYAYVRLNGEDFGLYLDLENLDDIALAKIFGSFDDETQHLYEGEVGDDVFPGGEVGFEIDEGPDDRGDLEALIDAVNGAGSSPWSERVAPFANLAEMTKMWAVEKYIDHWDGYAGHTDPVQAEKGERPNNYYLYSEPSGRFQMLPWGADQTWIPTIDVGTPGREVTFDGSGGVLFNKCLADEECFRIYWEALRDVTNAIATLDPGALAEGTASMLLSWQEGEVLDSTREEHGIGDVEDGVETSLDFIAGRQAEAEEWLEENEPPPLVIVDSFPQPQDSQAQTLAGKPAPAALFSRSGRAGRHLAVSLQLSGPGTVTVRGTVKARKGKRKVCVAGMQASSPGELTLDCKLSKAAMDTLARRALRLKLAITINLADGRTETILRSIRLARN